MGKMIRFAVALAAMAFFTGAVAFAQSSGQAVYRDHCQACHGPEGVPDATMAKMLGVPSVKDSAMYELTPAEMIATVKHGKGKMPAWWPSPLTDVQVKEVVAYFRTFTKK